MKLTDILDSLITESKARQARAAEDFLGKMVKSSPFKGKVYAVGGYVRDQLRGRNPKDLDIVVADKNGGIRFAEWITKKLGIYKNGSNPVIYPTFGTAKFQLYGITHNGVDLSDLEIEAVMTRTEKYTRGSRKPSVGYGDIAQDAKRRDLTYNALYKQLDTGKVIDPLKVGKADLEQNVARTTDTPDAIFQDDPLRMLRVVRFAVRDNSKVPTYMMKAIRANAASLKNISSERINDEVTKILHTNRVAFGLRMLAVTGLLPYVFGVQQLNYSVHGNITTGYLTHLAQIAAELGNKGIAALRTLKYTNDEIKTVERILNTIQGFDGDPVPDSYIRKIRLEYGDDIFEAALDLAIARGGRYRDTQNKWKSIPMKAEMPVNGYDIIAAFDLDQRKDGRTVGFVMKAIKSAWLQDPDLTREDALRIARNHIQTL